MAGVSNGPPPKAEGQRRRRNASIAMTKLPAEGRKGRTPAWPLIDDIVLTAKLDTAKSQVKFLLEEIDVAVTSSARSKLNRQLGAAQQTVTILTAQIKAQRKLERQVWTALWKTPQSVAWERLGWNREVAQYVRHKVLGELGDLKSAQEARQWSDRLGLSPMSMLRLRWEIAADEVADARETKEKTAARKQRRTRLRAVDTTAATGT